MRSRQTRKDGKRLAFLSNRGGYFDAVAYGFFRPCFDGLAFHTQPGTESSCSNRSAERLSFVRR